MNFIIISFLSVFLSDKQTEHPDFELSDNDTALVISIFSVAILIFTSMNSNIKNRLGTKNTIILGFSIEGLTMLGLGIICNF